VTDEASGGRQSGGGSMAPVLGAVALVAVAVVVAVFWPQPRTSLTQPSGTSAATVKVTHTTAGTGYRLVAEPVCVKHGAVTVQSVSPRNPVGGIHIVDWAVSAASRTGVPDARANLTTGRALDLPGYSNRSVTASCDTPQYLAISVDRSSSVGTAQGFDVTSSSGTIRTGATVELCAATCP